MIEQNRFLEGRNALVTGASRGIGRSIALSLADAGADVAITARSQDELKQVADEINQKNRTAMAETCDITVPDQVKRFADNVREQFGGIQILVNNAGMADSHPFRDHPDELWHDTIDVNLNGTYYVTKQILDQIIEHDWGRIINIASIVSKTSSKFIAAYTASKHGVLGLTRALALELVDHNITVNAICPGYVDTPMTDRNVSKIMEKADMDEQEARDMLASQSPQNRLMTPQEVASLTVYLCRTECRGINGQAINIDGGEVLW